MRPSPEEQARLKAEKEAKKAAKKAKYGAINEDNAIPIVEIRIPKRWGDEPANGPIRWKEIDLESPLCEDWIEAEVWVWRYAKAMREDKYPDDIYMGPVKRKIIRT